MTGARDRRIWWLNLDAERELADPNARVPSRAALDQIAARAARFAPELCQGDPFVVPGRDAPPWIGSRRATEASDGRTRALLWCPTPGALKDVAAAGFEPPGAPPAAVLRTVNDRRFALDLSRSAALVSLQERLDSSYPATRAFEAARSFEADFAAREPPLPVRLKRRFGFAGRGQRRCAPGRLATADEATTRWLRVAVEQGGFLLEPEVELELELSLHGLVDDASDGAPLVGRLCEQRCDTFGAPLQVLPAAAGRVPPLLAECLREAAGEVASALRGAGYFGPFGLDARLFRWRGQLGVQLIGDLNARFTLGWSTGMGDLRETALATLLRRTYPLHHS